LGRGRWWRGWWRRIRFGWEKAFSTRRRCCSSQRERTRRARDDAPPAPPPRPPVPPAVVVEEPPRRNKPLYAPRPKIVKVPARPASPIGQTVVQTSGRFLLVAWMGEQVCTHLCAISWTLNLTFSTLPRRKPRRNSTSTNSVSWPSPSTARWSSQWSNDHVSAPATPTPSPSTTRPTLSPRSESLTSLTPTFLPGPNANLRRQKDDDEERRLRSSR
jgi:hypothetical protein